MSKKNRTSKISSILLALLLCITALFSSVTITSAEVGEDEGRLTIHKLSSEGVAEADKKEGKSYHSIVKEGNILYYEYLAGAEYTIYKIGTLTQSNTTPIQVTYSPVSGLVDKVGTPVTKLDEQTKAEDLAPTNAMLVTGITNPLVTTATGPVSVLLPANGVYLIKETKLPADVNRANDFIITVPMYIEEQWEYEIDAYPKNLSANASIDKSILVSEGDGDVKKEEVHVNVGDIVRYQVDITVPADIESENYTKFVIKDTYSSSLEIDESQIVLTTDNSGYTLDEMDDYTIANSNHVLTITFTPDGIAKLKNGDKLTVLYSAVVLKGAADNTSGPATNEVELELKIDDKEIPPVVPPVTPEVKVYSYGIQKVGTDEDDTQEPLAGAKFVLATLSGGNYTYLTYDSTEATWAAAANKGAATVFETKTNGNGIDSEAILQFMNLDKEQKYYMIEIEAPSGYTALPNPIEIQATTDTTDVVYNSYQKQANGTYKYVEGVLNQSGFSMLLNNVSSSWVSGLLPSTGDSGIYMYMIIGLALIAGATFLYCISRRKDGKEKL